jgi:hypothetical protein
LHVPESDFERRDSIQYDQTSNKLSLKINAKDDSLFLDRYNVWINAFKEKFGTDCFIDTLFNKDVTIKKVMDLKQDLVKTTVNDKVIIAYSGHGLLSDSLDYFLSTYNVNFHKPENGGLAYESLEDLLDSIPARKKLMLIDAVQRPQNFYNPVFGYPASLILKSIQYLL